MEVHLSILFYPTQRNTESNFSLQNKTLQLNLWISAIGFLVKLTIIQYSKLKMAFKNTECWEKATKTFLEAKNCLPIPVN